jgi:putative ABC transport system permease protein
MPALTFDRVLERLQQVPGVVSAAAVSTPPFSGSALTAPFAIDDRSIVRAGAAGDTARESQPTTSVLAVTRGFFATMRIRILKGRDFDAHDTADTPFVTIVNETMARQYFPNDDPIGKRITLDFVPDERPREIIAVVGDTVANPFQAQQEPAVYVPHVQQTSRFVGPWVYNRIGLSFVVRTTGDPLRLVPSVKQAVADVDRNTPVANVRTIEQTLGDTSRHLRLYTLLLGIFGAVAIMLAATGIYGVMAYAVSQRSREIGIRVALGARAHDVLRLVLRQAAWVVGTGLVIGLLGSLALSRLLQSALFHVTPSDPATYAGVSLVLILIAALACLLPTRRAIAVDPTVTLKYE